MGSMATGDEGETRRCDGYPCVNGRTRAAMAMVEGEIEMRSFWRQSFGGRGLVHSLRFSDSLKCRQVM